MKVLFVGSTKRTALALHYYTNMLRMDFQVLPYDLDCFRTKTLWERAQVRLTKAPMPSRLQEVRNGLLSLCKRNRFDVILVMAENFLDKDLLEEARRASKTPPLLVYHSHDNNFSPGILKPPHFFETLKSYDLVFTTKSQNVEKMKAMGIERSFFVLSAYEPSIHHPVAPEYTVYGNTWFPITFIGTYDRSRAKYIEAIDWNRLHVWGDHWKRYPQYKKYQDRIHPTAIYDFEFADVTSHSKCALGLLREEASDLHTTRTFEIPACGALQFAPRNEEILSLFEENEEIVLFESPEELRDKVQYYLKHEPERLKVARQGHERLLNGRHTYLDRVAEMFRIITGAGLPLGPSVASDLSQ